MKLLRSVANYTQKGLGEMIGLRSPQQEMMRFERGARIPMDKLRLIASLLGVTMGHFVDEVTSPIPRFGKLIRVHQIWPKLSEEGCDLAVKFMETLIKRKEAAA